MWHNKEALTHLEKDPVLKDVMDVVNEEIKPVLDIDIYQSLLKSIVSQQLSTKVADIIWHRFLDLFVDRYPGITHVINQPHQQLRNVGLSNSKAHYIRNVALFAEENRMDFDFLNGLTDKEIIDYLTQIKGVGQWTVQMILMFPMDRPNVFPVNDLGIQKAVQKAYGLTLEKKALLVKMERISAKWSPYKTLASKYLWRYLEV